MARHSRLDAAGVLHHVIVRGIERRKIFLDDNDRRNFLDRCGVIFPDTKTSCYAFALLPNHVHLLLRTGITPLSTTMARLLTGYAVYFNRVHRRHGHLFQNRYKSIVCQEDMYLKGLVRYVHLNPLRARLVPDVERLASYPYSGHASLMGTSPYPRQDTAFILSVFGTSVRQGRRAYLDFAREAPIGRRTDLTGGGLLRSAGGWAEVVASRERIKGDVRILGDSAFVLDVLSNARQKLDHRYRMKTLGVDLFFIEKKVLELCCLARDDLYSRGRRKDPASARGLLCYWAVTGLGMSQTELAARLGMSQPGVAAAVARGERIARERGHTLLGDVEES